MKEITKYSDLDKRQQVDIHGMYESKVKARSSAWFIILVIGWIIAGIFGGILTIIEILPNCNIYWLIWIWIFILLINGVIFLIELILRVKQNKKVFEWFLKNKNLFNWYKEDTQKNNK